jgi:hypothetical protein
MSQNLLETKQAILQILKGDTQSIRVGGPLKLATPQLERLPEHIEASSLDVSGCPNLRELPSTLKVRHLNISGCRKIEKWPEELEVYELQARETALETLPPGWQVKFRLDLSHCTNLKHLPENFSTGSLILSGCTSLQRLPEGLEVYFLDLAGCTQLENWPNQASVRVGRLDISGCTRVKVLPSWLRHVSQLNVGHCSNLTALPEGLTVSSWLELADSPIEQLPPSLQNAPLRWRGVPVDSRIVFAPETISATEVLSESNAEKRRVMLERMGYEKFLLQANAKTLDTDRDPGGERRLLRVEWQDDEPLVCLAVYCPSTGRQYMLRVPPRTTTCHAAAAWIAGFDNPDDYRPIAET